MGGTHLAKATAKVVWVLIEPKGLGKGERKRWRILGKIKDFPKPPLGVGIVSITVVIYCFHS